MPTPPPTSVSVNPTGLGPARTDRGSGSRRRLLGMAAVAAGSPFQRLALTVPAVLLAGCAAPAVIPTPGSQPLPAPALRRGDRWTYREINRYNQSEVARVEETITALTPTVTVETRVLAGEFSAGRVLRPGLLPEARFDAQWRVSREVTYDMPLEFAAPMPMLPERLLVGQRRQDATTFRVQGISGDYYWRQQLVAETMTKVITPAGQFDALQVRRVISWQPTDPFRFDASREDILYYAPEVNRWVVREWRGRYRHETMLDDPGVYREEDWVRRELVEYRPAG